MPPCIPIQPVAASTRSLVLQSRPIANAIKPPLNQHTSASFSTTSCRAYNSKERRHFWQWLSKERSARFRKPNPKGGTNYLPHFGALKKAERPFPLNDHYVAHPVLSDKTRELIWTKVMRNGETIKAVSAEIGVDINRVAAVVRLKEVEKDWVSKGKKLAVPYAEGVSAMMRQFVYKPGGPAYEPINELHIHPYTMKQLFWPTSESREFTREDAAKAFNRKMLPADERVPHPELIRLEKDLLEGKDPWEARAHFIAAAEESERKAAEEKVLLAQAEQKATTRVSTGRFEFRFKDFNSENVGYDGRAVGTVGARYGRPSYDRAKGAIKIPTSVP